MFLMTVNLKLMIENLIQMKSGDAINLDMRAKLIDA